MGIKLNRLFPVPGKRLPENVDDYAKKLGIEIVYEEMVYGMDRN